MDQSLHKRTKKVDEHKQKLNQETSAYEAQRKTIQQLEKELVGFNKTSAQTIKNGTGAITGYKNTYVSPTGQKLTATADSEGIVNKYAQTRDYAKQLSDIQKISDGRMKSEIRVREEERKTNEAQQRAIQKNADSEREQYSKKLNQLKEFQRKYEESYAKMGSQKLSLDNAQKLDNSILQTRNLNVADPNLANKMRDISRAFNDVGQSAKASTTGISAFINSATKLASHVPVFMAVHTAIYGVFNAISEGFKGMIDIESKMAGYIQTNEHYFKSLDGDGLDTKKVNDQTKQFIITAHALGAEIGEVTESARLWGRMYKDVGVVQELVRQSTMLSTVDLVSLEDATKSMESVLAQYGVQLKNTADAQLYGNRILDSWSKVAHETMAPAKDLGAAFERMGKIASETGVSFDFMNGLVSSGVRNTALSGENLGNMWKTVLGTIRTDKAVKELERLGVKTKDVVNGVEQWRKAEDILLDLSISVTDKNYDLTQSYADISRGVYQYAKLAASLNAGDILLGTSKSINSTGSTVEYLMTQMDTIQRKSSQVKTSFLEIFNTAGDNGLRSTLKGILDVIDQLLLGINKIPSGVIGASAAFVGLAGVAALAKQPIINFITALGVLRTAKVADVAATAANTAANSVNIISSNGMTLSTVQKTAATSTSIVATEGATIATGGLATAQAAATVTMGLMTGGLTILVGALAVWAVSAGAAEKQHRDTTQKIKDEIAANNQLISQQNRQAEFLPKVVKAYDTYNKLSTKQTLSNKQQQDVKKQLAEIEQVLNETVQEGGLARLKAAGMSEAALNHEIDLINQKTEADRAANKEKLKGQIETNDKEKIDKYNQLIAKEKELKELQKKKDSALDLDTSHMYTKKIYKVSNQLEVLKTDYADLEKNQKDYNDQLMQLNSDQFDQLTGAMGKLTEGTKTAEELTEELNKGFEETVDSLSNLASAYETLNKGESLSADTIVSLIDKYPQLASYLAQTNDLTFNKGELLKKVAEIERKARIDEYQNSIDSIEVTRSELIKKQDLYRQYFENMIATKQPLDNWMFGSALTNEEQKALDSFNTDTEALQAKIKVLNQPLSFFNTKTEDKKKQKESNNTISETNELLTETQKRLAAIKNELSDLENKRSRIKQGSKAYRDSIAQENKLLEEQRSLLKDGIKNPNKLLAQKVTTTTKVPSDSSSSGSDYSSNNSGVSSLLSTGKELQGKFTYKQVSGEYKGTFNQFVQGATSDCSQFVQEMFKEFLDIKLPRTAAEQAKKGTSVKKEDLQEGDLVFFNTTGKANSHVGIYSGNGKMLQMGNSGLKESDINSSYWAPKYQGAKRISGASSSNVTVSSSSSSSSKTKVRIKNASESDKNQAILEATSQLSDTELKIYQNKVKYIDDVILESQNKIGNYDNLISKSQVKQSQYIEASKEWQAEELAQIAFMDKQQKELDLNNNNVKWLVQNKKITAGEFDKQIADNELKRLEIEKQKQEKSFSIIISRLDVYTGKIDVLKNKLDESTAKMGLMTEGTKEYNDALQAQIPLLKQEQKEHQSKIDLINLQLQNNKLTAANKKELILQLQAETTAWLDNEAAIKTNIERMAQLRQSAADRIIDEYKNMLQKQQKLETDALDKRTEIENKRHDQIKKNLDEENKLFEDVINAQLKMLDLQNNKDDYESELNKKLKDRQKLSDDINKYARDDSIEGKAKKKELQEQLDAKNEEIDKFKLDRDRELRKQNLQDQLDDHKKHTDKISEDEDQLNKDTLDNIEKEKKAVEQKYSDILDNEKYFYDLKQGLLSKDSEVVKTTLAEMQTGYDTYFGQLKSHVFDTNQEFENLNYTLQKSLEMLQKYSNSDYSENNDFKSGYTPSSPSTNSDTSKEKVAAWNSYLNNKKSAESITQQVVTLNKTKPNSADIAKLKSQLDNLKAQNDSLRTKYGFPDGSYSELKTKDIFSAETGGMTPSFSGGKYLLAHEKELVLKKDDTANLIKAVILNRDLTQPNYPSMQNITKNNGLDSRDNSFKEGDVYMNIRIDKIIGDESGAQTVFSKIQKGMKKLGR